MPRALAYLSATALLAGLVTGPADARADSPADRKLATARTPILGDHLNATLPDGMTLAPRRASIMSAENAADDETRGMLDDGSARFVMMAYELYGLAGTDPKTTVEADFKRARHEATLSAVTLPKPLVGFQFTPTKFASDKDANLVHGLYVVSGDGSVQVLAFYVNTAGAAKAADWAALAKKVVATLAPGKRVLAGTSGVRAAGDLVVTVPAGFVTTAQPGPDFLVTHLRKLSVLGQDTPSCGIYIGAHPSLQYKQTASKAPPKTIPGKLAGAKVDWTLWNSRGRWWTEALTPHPNGKQQIHAFCSTPTEAEVPDLRKVVETLRKK
ncbi:MAG: hypothetical protein KIT31_39815 [Deltaproteobacteria bacterium]|nr:hypothetical protein [Deltaproteobacteria bacterium]